MALLEIADLHTYYGNIQALRGISVSVDDGEIVTLIGANGAGKTTTLNTISGLLRPRSGQVHFDGSDLTSVPAHAVVPTSPAIAPTTMLSPFLKPDPADVLVITTHLLIGSSG